MHEFEKESMETNIILPLMTFVVNKPKERSKEILVEVKNILTDKYLEEVRY